ncbi:hypothetical protein BUALT_Bualt13G0049800 [Buddleja alternifolia]|uniref:DRBM domain-containing protein n=1 Tax=Buddleja alternifolia TaxID=168488 RepID=A0AAV6WIZ4_9LAMI|nr:hypothetical protein BUALT_Bualt13G0049800 [Buddleja alternifolia]
MYKSKLQELCQKQKRALPKYTCVKDGHDHSPLFKASVVLGGATFDSAACKSSKHAYNEAAKFAFLHFTSEPPNQKSENAEKKNSKVEVQSSNAQSENDVVAVKQGENLG